MKSTSCHTFHSQLASTWEIAYILWRYWTRICIHHLVKTLRMKKAGVFSVIFWALRLSDTSTATKYDAVYWCAEWADKYKAVKGIFFLTHALNEIWNNFFIEALSPHTSKDDVSMVESMICIQSETRKKLMKNRNDVHKQLTHSKIPWKRSVQASTLEWPLEWNYERAMRT